MKKLLLFVLIPFMLLAQETRSLWVTRWDYQSPEDIQKIIKNAAEYNFNTILFQVRGAASTFYPSEVEPWAVEMGENPGWDPLKLAIELAHTQNLELHAWMNVYTCWQGNRAPENPEHVYNTHNDWIMTDMFGVQQKLNSHYVWLSPTNPEVFLHLKNVFNEVLTKYNVDGIHFDYIRFPAVNYSYDKGSVDYFIKKNGVHPNEAPDKWKRWRNDAITILVKEVHDRAKKINPRIAITSSVIADYTRGSRMYHQQSHQWLAAGIVDAIYPMIYTSNYDLFNTWLQEHQLNNHNRHVYPGIDTRDAVQVLTQYRDSFKQGVQGVALFSYESLFPNHEPAPEYAEALQSIWPERAKPAAMPWKNKHGDNQGPVIKRIHTIPSKVYQNKKFKIAAQIVDPSNIFTDSKKGVYLVYGSDWPIKNPKPIKMVPREENPEWYITEKHIPRQKAGFDFRCRIFATDDYHDENGEPQRNVGYSDIWSTTILLPGETFVSDGPFGPRLVQPNCIETDGDNNVWVGASNAPLRVIDKNGEEKNYSPIANGLDENGEQIELGSVYDLAYSPKEKIMYIISPAKRNLIFRYDLKLGKFIKSIPLTYNATQMDCDDFGTLYILDKDNVQWHVLTADGKELDGSPFRKVKKMDDICVSPDGDFVILSGKASTYMEIWTGGISLKKATYSKHDRIKHLKIGAGKLFMDKKNRIYLNHSRKGLITVYDKSGRPIEYITGGSPELDTPIDIALDKNQKTMYVLEDAGLGATQLIRWVK